MDAPCQPPCPEAPCAHPCYSAHRAPDGKNRESHLRASRDVALQLAQWHDKAANGNHRRAKTMEKLVHFVHHFRPDPDIAPITQQSGMSIPYTQSVSQVATQRRRRDPYRNHLPNREDPFSGEETCCDNNCFTRGENTPMLSTNSMTIIAQIPY